MEAKGIKWCPQHGYPLPCHKCGMPLSQQDQRDIYKAGIKEVVEFVNNNSIYDLWIKGGKGKWEAKLKEWGIK